MFSNEYHWALDDKIDIDFFYSLGVICSFGINMRTEVHFLFELGNERTRVTCKTCLREDDARLQRRQPWATLRVTSNVPLSARHFPRKFI